MQSNLLFETTEEVYRRIFRELRPRTAVPEISISYGKLANASSSICLAHGRIDVKLSDLLEGTPAPVVEALARILLGKLLGKPAAPAYRHRYRLFLNRKDIRQRMQLVRQLRGRKHLSGPQGQFFNLEAIFDDLNSRFFHGLLAQPNLGWSRGQSRTALGHFDPSHNAIIISRIFDQDGTPILALEYVMFHEMLHLQFPVDHSKSRRCVHTKEFRQAEKEFPGLAEAKDSLKKLP